MEMPMSKTRNFSTLCVCWCWGRRESGGCMRLGCWGRRLRLSLYLCLFLCLCLCSCCCWCLPGVC
ncbi:hypothetical protein BJX76DRAFT_336424 [Aspergillus varians]